jgi:hypothetical protein
MSKPIVAAALLVAAACADEPTAGPDAGAPPAAVRTAERKRLERLEDRMSPPALVDETVITPHQGTYPITGLASDGGHHYVLGEGRVHVLAADGTPVDRHGIALDLPDIYFAEERYAIGAADGQVGVVYEHRYRSLRLRLYRQVDGGLAPDPVEAVIQGAPGSGLVWPSLVHGAGAWWVVYNSPEGPTGARHDVVSYRRFAADGAPLDAAPVAIAKAPPGTRVLATFAGGQMVIGWQDGDAAAMTRVAGDGRLLDSTPVRFAGTGGSLELTGDDHELLLRRSGTAQRLGHDLVAVGAPITFVRRFLRAAHVAPTGHGFRVVWTDLDGTHMIDLPTGAEPGAAVTLDGVRQPGDVVAGPGDATIVVHAGDSLAPPEVTRVAAGGAIAGRDLLYEVLRSDHLGGLTGTDAHRAATWSRDPGETVEATLTATGAVLAPPQVRPRDTALAARAGGYWRVAATSVQPLDAALAPVGAPIEHSVGGAQLAPLGDRALLVWHQDGGLHGQRIGLDGPIGAPFLIIAGVSQVVVSAGADEWLLTWADRATLRALRVGADGALRDAAPRELVTGSSVEAASLAAVHVGGGNYTVAWDGSFALHAARLGAGGGFEPAFDLESEDPLAGGRFAMVADGAATLIITSMYDGLPAGFLYRLDATGRRLSRAIPHDLPPAAVVRTAPGRFLVLADVPWTVDGAAGRRLVARELTLDVDGVACSSSDECVSGVCADGVCCDRACGSGDGDCAACSVAAGAARDGVCGPRAAGAECRAAAGACDAAETCDGAGTACPVDGPAADDTACDDGDRCTTGDACRGGACGGAAVECPAPGECQAATCDRDQGCGTAPVRDGTACSGGLCVAGVCVAAPVDAGVPDAGLDAGRPDARLPDAGSPGADAGPIAADGDDGGCQAGAGGAPAWLGLALLALARRRRTR